MTDGRHSRACAFIVATRNQHRANKTKRSSTCRSVAQHRVHLPAAISCQQISTSSRTSPLQRLCSWRPDRAQYTTVNTTIDSEQREGEMHNNPHTPPLRCTQGRIGASCPRGWIAHRSEWYHHTGTVLTLVRTCSLRMWSHPLSLRRSQLPMNCSHSPESWTPTCLWSRGTQDSCCPGAHECTCSSHTPERVSM
jgi:hypothetical protein